MRWKLDLRETGARPKYQCLVDFIADAIRTGQLQPGERIPSVAELARRLKVNKLTVVRAFRELETRQLLSSQVGRGSFVAGADQGPQTDGAVQEAGPVPPDIGQLVRRLRNSHVSGLVQLLALEPRAPAINLRASVPPEDSVSAALLQERCGQVCREHGQALLRYAHYGFGPLREGLAAWLAQRGYTVSADEILITNGSQQALALVATWARDGGRTVFCETPTYIGIPRMFTQSGHQVESVAWDGPELALGPVAAAARSRPGLVYCCPEFHNPTGQCLGEATRQALVQLTAHSDTVVVVDDIFRDLRFEGDEPPSLYQTLAPGRRILVGSFSKSFAPGLRVGFLAADRPLIEDLAALKRWSDLGGPSLVQAVMLSLLTDGYAQHLEKIRAHYRVRRDAVVAALEEHMPPGVTWTLPKGSFHLWVRMPAGHSAVELYLRGLEGGVAVQPGPAHDVDGRFLNCFRLGYAWASPAEIGQGVQTLAGVVRALLEKGPAEPSATGLGLPLY
jgi:DNA-binding transcriptional MocR family regulator